MKNETTTINIDRGKGDFFYPEVHVRDAGVGLSERTVHYIADVKGDPDWVRDFRLRALKTFLEKPLPTHWASDKRNETSSRPGLTNYSSQTERISRPDVCTHL